MFFYPDFMRCSRSEGTWNNSKHQGLLNKNKRLGGQVHPITKPIQGNLSQTIKIKNTT